MTEESVVGRISSDLIVEALIEQLGRDLDIRDSPLSH